ncbi:hypothetical protein [Nocardia sp. NPDC050793]|uniref:hypothetical protein n=1 Tax=Nocardia sp. NPDC050793 TaxID=3155159 RepID=UPI0033EB11D9
METGAVVAALLDSEARGLLSRLNQIKPFVMHETMVQAAALPTDAQLIIERFLHAGREQLRTKVSEFLRWLHGPGRSAPAAQQQKRFVLVRLEFNVVLTQFDLFTEVVTQRSEAETGIWLSGLDVLADDALRVDVEGTREARAVCYLARGAGAAIRRANTRLPGGKPNPVAIIRIPRERMIGSGIASSLCHEVGHQGAAQLDLVTSLRVDIRRAARTESGGHWLVFDRWISEIIADMWSVGKLGLTSTVGLLAVVSLPKFFVFRDSGDDPHPTPYLRVLISSAVGEALYPHPQWQIMRSTWKQMYPIDVLPSARRTRIENTEAAIGRLVDLLVHHRAPALKGRELGSIWPLKERRPENLGRLHQEWGDDVAVMARQSPSLVFAVIGQAKATGAISPEAENALLTRLLTIWAVRSSLDAVHRVNTPHQPSNTPPDPGRQNSHGVKNGDHR